MYIAIFFVKNLWQHNLGITMDCDHNSPYTISENDFDKILSIAYKELEPRRILHSVSCGMVLSRLCPNFGYKNALSLSLMHDRAHHWSEEELKAFIKEHNIPLEKGESDYYMLLHAPVGAALLKETVPSVPDEWVIAIRRHTVPASDMDDLAYGLFVADIIEPTRPFITDEEREKVYNMKNNTVRFIYTLEKQEIFLKKNGSGHLDCTKALYNSLKSAIL